MKIIKVKSSQFKFIGLEQANPGYTDIHVNVRIYFPNAAYNYLSVPSASVLDLLLAPSTGSHFIHNLKKTHTVANGGCVKLEGESARQSRADLAAQWDGDPAADALVARYDEAIAEGKI
jgi:hypothetical protein